MRSKLYFLLALLFLGSMFEPCLDPAADAQIYRPVNRFRWNVKESKKNGQAAIFKAMELHAKVVMMLAQGSDNVAAMQKLLDQSYGQQASAIAMMERLKQAEDFRDPIKERLIQNMYDWGKPGTLSVKAQIDNGEFDSALAQLQRIKGLHTQVSTVFY